jgi:hypothetical protein
LPTGRWTLGPQDGSCNISFSFPPPHEDYSGEVRAATGWVEIEAAGHASGSFTVCAADVDMGEPDLTENVRFAAEMLRGKDFPYITFDFENAHLSGCRSPSDGAPPKCAPAVSAVPSGHPAHSVVLDGTFRLKGVAIPLSVPAQVEFIPRENETDLHLQGAFELHDLRKRFAISGPGGDDDPAGDTLRLTFDFLLTPAGVQPQLETSLPPRSLSVRRHKAIWLTTRY